MSVQTQIDRIDGNVKNALAKIAEKGVTVPTDANSDDLETLIDAIATGGGGNADQLEPTEDDIPKVFFGAALPQTKNDTIMSFRYISKTQDISGYCKTKAQGSSSTSYPKKNQTVKLYADAECTEKLKVNFKDWGEQNKFCFKANWIDLTHARNIATARLWGDVVKSRADYADIPELLRTSPNQGAIDGFPVKVYAGGVYQGRYTINIPKDAWMASMNDSLDTHCILCGESNVDDRSLFRATASIDGSDWSDEVHDSVPNAIKIRWNEAIAFIVNSTDEEFVSGIGNYFDVENLIDYYLFGLASCGLDAFGKNQLYMTYDGQKWYATMYDMDSTWGLWWNGESFVSETYKRTEYQDFKDGNGNLLYIRLESLFVDEIRDRWVELRTSVLSIENIINRFERFTDIVPAELVKEDYASTTGGGAFTGIPSKDTNNIQQIRGYAVDRLKYCDAFIRYLGETESYTMLSYIESDGNQWIDTGISGGTNASYELLVQHTDAEYEIQSYDYLFAGAKSGAAPYVTFYTWDGFHAIADNEAFSAPFSYLKNETGIITFGLRYNSDGTVYSKWGSEDWSQLTPTIGDTSDVAGRGWGDKNWYVFNCPEENNVITMRLYYLKMYTDGVLVRDFIPARRDSDGEIGLWDNVSSTFFENLGTGVFTGA